MNRNEANKPPPRELHYTPDNDPFRQERAAEPEEDQVTPRHFEEDYRPRRRSHRGVFSLSISGSIIIFIGACITFGFWLFYDIGVRTDSVGRVVNFGMHQQLVGVIVGVGLMNCGVLWLIYQIIASRDL